MPHGRKLAVIGLGYVGLPVAVAFAARGTPVIGFDIDEARIHELKSGLDRTHEVAGADLAHPALRLTSNPREMAKADFFIITVPTPVDISRRPDLSALLGASRSVGEVLKRGDVVVFESTVYPGATEEDCVPILEQASGLAAGRDFTVGYSQSGSILATRRIGLKQSRRWSPGRTLQRSTSLLPSTVRWLAQGSIERRQSRSRKPPR